MDMQYDSITDKYSDELIVVFIGGYKHNMMFAALFRSMAEREAFFETFDYAPEAQEIGKDNVLSVEMMKSSHEKYDATMCVMTINEGFTIQQLEENDLLGKSIELACAAIYTELLSWSTELPPKMKFCSETANYIMERYYHVLDVHHARKGLN